MSTMYEDVDMENPDGVYGDGAMSATVLLA